MTRRRGQTMNPRSSLKMVTENLPNAGVHPFLRDKMEIVVQPTHENGWHGVMRSRATSHRVRREVDGRLEEVTAIFATMPRSRISLIHGWRSMPGVAIVER